MTLPPLFSCHFCERPIDPKAPGIWRQVTGWVQNRKAGGANSISLAEPGHIYACNVCLDIAKSRHNPNQTSLF